MAHRNMAELIDELPKMDRDYITRRMAGETRMGLAFELDMDLISLLDYEKGIWSQIRAMQVKDGKDNPLMPQHSHEEDGFTLVEISIVVTVAALIGSLALSNFHQMRVGARSHAQRKSALILQNAAISVGTFDIPWPKRSSLILTKDNVAPWIKGGFEALSVEGDVPTMPELTSDQFYYTDVEDIATLMW